MGYIITALITIVTGVLVFVLQMVIKENRELHKEKEEAQKAKEKEAQERARALEEGVVSLLRKELLDEHTKYTEQGYISSKALEVGLSMYDAYKGLGGNGMMDHLKDEIEALPVKKG